MDGGAEEIGEGADMVAKVGCGCRGCTSDADDADDAAVAMDRGTLAWW